MTRNKKSVAVVGLGYVGLPLALLAARKGYTTYGIDIDQNKIDKLAKRIPPYKDADVQRELKKSTMIATRDISKVQEVSTVVICVPTPVFSNHMPNLEPVQKACEGIAPYLHKDQLVILESTVNPGVCESIVIPILEEISGLKAGEDFYVAHCPERINPGDKKWNVENIPRVVGSLEEKGLKLAKDFYESILVSKVKKMKSLKEAEAVKIVENSFRDINIAFVNELARSFAKLGIDVVNVIDGASTKPFAFMAHYPGCGVGGHCIPVDPYYLIQYAKQNGFQHKFLELARRINN
jgi:UDP-N-acetyl-D-glucosamine dehydrogenase